MKRATSTERIGLNPVAAQAIEEYIHRAELTSGHHDRMKLGTPKSCTRSVSHPLSPCRRGCGSPAQLSTNPHTVRYRLLDLLQVHVGVFAPRMPNIRPHNAHGRAPSAPSLPRKSRLSTGPEFDIPGARTRHSCKPALHRTGSPPLAHPRKRPQNAELPGPHCTTSGHGTFTPRPTVQRRSWKTRQAS